MGFIRFVRNTDERLEGGPHVAGEELEVSDASLTRWTFIGAAVEIAKLSTPKQAEKLAAEEEARVLREADAAEAKRLADEAAAADMAALEERERARVAQEEAAARDAAKAEPSAAADGQAQAEKAEPAKKSAKAK